MKKKVFAALVLVVVLLVLKTLSDAGAFRTITPMGSEGCRRLEGVVGAEDADVDPQTGLVFLTSQDRRAWMAGQPSPGGLFVWNPAAEAPPAALALGGFTGEFHPHGLSFFRNAEGARLFVVNHPTLNTSSIEVFAVSEGPTLAHLRTVTAPEFISLNDVAAVGLDAFYATNDAGTVNETAGRVAETFLKLPWASVVFFDGQAARVVATGFKYANGIALSLDRRAVFVSESTGRRLFAFARDEASGALTERVSQRLESGLDNVSIDASGALWVAAHPNMVAFLDHAKNAGSTSPSQVVRARWDGGAAFETSDVLLDDGSKLSGSSVALPLGGSRFLVGSVFEPHLLDCR